MTIQFETVQRALDGDVSIRDSLTGPHRRLADAWLSDRPGAEIVADVAALISQVLRHEREVTSYNAPHLRLKLDERTIATDVLARSNLRCTRYGKTEHLVTVKETWAPEWLHGDPRWIDVACASPGPYRGGTPEEVPTYARPDDPVPADPALIAIAPSITKYRSKTQAAAVRTAILGNPKSTLHVVLPTGTGKSIVGLAPGMLHPAGNTLVVVPTIALALDQERTIHARFPGMNLPPELAYYGDRADGGKEAIRERLRAGTQRVVFTSPEAVTSGLAPALHALAARGTLTSIVIDEAHLVRSWGLDFRPEYQLVSALVSELRAIATASGHREPHVILLTATLSEEGLELNDALFRGSEKSTFVGSAFLRTELRYLMGASQSREERLDRIVEAMHHLPRPAIIYVARKLDAEEITARLKDAGFSRVGFFHGGVKEEKRLSILKGWSGSAGPSQLDVVVGTSAFGLGVDQSDVRSVVHACAPAFVDRFYQEVGRSGRDGHAAVSVWLTAPGDVNEGRSIEGSTLIGDEKTWNRWEGMRLHSAKVDSDSGLFVADTSVTPKHLTYMSDSNRLWNRNTLTLMERAGLVSIEATPPPDIQRNEDEDEANFEARRQKAWEEFRNHVRVRVNGTLNLDRATFEASLQQLRADIRATEKASHGRIDKLLARSECWAHVLASEYTFKDVGPMHAALAATPACSGCPAEQHTHRLRLDAPIPLVSDSGMPNLHRDVSDALKGLAAGGNVVIVSYAGSLRLLLKNLVQRCITNGVRGILASQSLITHPAVVSTASQSADEGLVCVDPITKGLPQISFATPTLILLDDTDSPNLSWLNPSSGPLRIVVVPESTEDPGKAGHKIMDYRSPHWGMHDFLRRI
ncbi:protein DpdF [Pseudarthrobacter sp. NPDC058119]|uniref:protein DpdF n=1 Tax=Pseudarthrobacter sp. NPDC058119 TaxID=3346348 RepID=UPI0036DD7C4B